MQVPMGGHRKGFHHQVGAQQVGGDLMVSGVGRLHVGFGGRPQPVGILWREDGHRGAGLLLQLDG